MAYGRSRAETSDDAETKKGSGRRADITFLQPARASWSEMATWMARRGGVSLNYHQCRFEVGSRAML